MTKYQRDLAERICRSFIGGVIAAATMSLTSPVTDISSAKALVMGAICGGISAVLGLLSKGIGDPNSAGTS